MSKLQWIGPDDSLTVGQVGFLVRHHSENHGTDRWELRDTPAYTNQSHKPRLNGWCGSWNNVGTYGEGMAEVVKVARNGRAQVRLLEGEELQAALDELGYPDLTPDD